jgi:hypothetical protein
MKRFTYLLAVAALLAVMVIGAACSDDDDENEEPTTEGTAEATEVMAGEIPTVEITGTDYAFEAPASIAGGVTRFVFNNESAGENHQAQLLKLNEGVTIEAVGAAESEAELFGLVAAAGGPGAGPGLTSENVLNLEPGQYAVICLIPSPDDGVVHAEKGMVAALEVTEAPSDQPELSAADVSVALSDYVIDAPTTLASGPVTFDVVNNGAEPHELAVLQLGAGLSVPDLLDIILAEPDPNAPPPEGPPPFAFVGQMAVLSDGLSGQTTIDLAPGTYGFVCFVFNAEGVPHAALGMTLEVVVE